MATAERERMMRIFVVLLACTLSTAALADPTCEVNERAGAFATTYVVPEGAVKSSVPVGTEVEIVTHGQDSVHNPYALIREPGQLETNYGWTERRYLTCR
ncbi:MAG: hypothetical protein AAGB11_05935 [Pseudomonadota bacterium]